MKFMEGVKMDKLKHMLMVLGAAGFAGGAFAAVNSIPFCKDYGTASLRPDPTGAGEIAVAAPRSHGGVVIKAENFGFSVTNDDNGAAVAAAVREAKRVGAAKVLLAPGVYRCFGDPIVIDGLVGFELDGCGAELVSAVRCGIRSNRPGTMTGRARTS